MRRANFALPALVLVISGLLAASVVVGLSARDDLGDARRRADAAWQALRAPLAERYEALGAAGVAVRERLGGSRPLLQDITTGLEGWKKAGSVDAQVRAANRLEGLAVRLAALSAATPRLRTSTAVQGALAPLTSGPPAKAREAFNQEVGAYEAERGGFPRRLVAGAFGFDARLTFEALS
jgi:hypothetical protein